MRLLTVEYDEDSGCLRLTVEGDEDDAIRLDPMANCVIEVTEVEPDSWVTVDVAERIEPWVQRRATVANEAERFIEAWDTIGPSQEVDDAIDNLRFAVRRWQGK